MSILQGYDIEIRHIPGKVNPADTLTRKAWAEDASDVAKVKDIDRELVDMIRIAESASDQDIQAKLRELYSSSEDREKIQHAQESILSEIRTEEGNAILSVASSRVTVSNEFRARLVRGILADEDYVDIYEKLQDPNETNKVTERGRTLSRLLRTAHRGSQVPVRFLFVDGIEMQPRVRQ